MGLRCGALSQVAISTMHLTGCKVSIAMPPIRAARTGANAMTLQAHYTNGSKARSAKLDLATGTDDGYRVWVKSFEVDGKATARKLAKAHGATPWNF